LGGIL
jgi:hypothetical protein